MNPGKACSTNTCSRKRLYAKRHHVNWAKALDGVWPVDMDVHWQFWYWLSEAPSSPCLSTALHRHDQLAKYHPVPWLRWHNVSWHQVFCYWGPWFLVLGSLLFVANCVAICCWLCCYLLLIATICCYLSFRGKGWDRYTLSDMVFERPGS